MYKEIKKDLIGIFFVYIVIVLLVNINSIGVDDSDNGGFDRSGLKVHTDHKTCLQYLSSTSGGLIKRVAADGKQILEHDCR